MIGAIRKSSLIDYPGKIACVIFTVGCNFRCPYCHNSFLLNTTPIMSIEEVLKFLDERKDFLEAVVISGGEPTIHPELEYLVTQIKEMGYLIKLDTNGSNPEMISRILKYLDFISMDVKTSLKKYPEFVKYNNIKNILKSIEIIKSSQVNHEFRITIVEPIHKEEDVIEVAKLVSPSKLVLQQFIPQNCLDPSYLRYKTTSEYLYYLKDICRKITQIEVRIYED
jgi:pyruvate formate lyase activating enzyme